ncbi:MAG: YbaK/EbsC family protein [Clostridia bacterium]|nr:YbaK/EbsC family protein [Clostridia bacterium]
MSIELVKAYLAEKGYGERVLEFSVSSATVELAAQALGCEPCRIAKTLSFLVGEDVILIVAAGDAKVDNPKYKACFGTKAKMIPFAEVEEKTGHAAGGVCPFVVKQNVKVYLDTSLQRFDIVYPAAGSASSAVRLTPQELYSLSNPVDWVDVCKTV